MPARKTETTEATLTKREREVLLAKAKGASNKEAATASFVSKRTVDFHLANIYRKLGVNNVMSAVWMAAQRGLLQPLPKTEKSPQSV